MGDTWCVAAGRMRAAANIAPGSSAVTVCDGDQMRLTARGDPEVRALFVPISQVTIMDTWEVSGLAGTGSHDVVIEQVFVPEAYSGSLARARHPTARTSRGRCTAIRLSGLCPAYWGPCLRDRPRGGGDGRGTGADQTAGGTTTLLGSTRCFTPAGGSCGLGAFGAGVVIRRGAADLGGHADPRRGPHG